MQQKVWPSAITFFMEEQRLLFFLPSVSQVLHANYLCMKKFHAQQCIQLIFVFKQNNDHGDLPMILDII